MPSVTNLPLDDLRDAGDAVETLIEFRDHLPPGGMLLMLAGRFRDDLRELLGMPALGRVTRGPVRKTLGDLTDGGLDRLDRALGTLLGRYTRYVDDPELISLLGELHGAVSAKLAERGRVAEAKAS
jgi:hypothetical protein